MKSLSTVAALLAFVLLWNGCGSSVRTGLPGPMAGGQVLLPNGWKLSPAGKQIDLGDLPLNVELTPGGRYAIVTDNGNGRQDLTVVDLRAERVVQILPVRRSWLGLRLFDGGRQFAMSGGDDNRIFLFRFDDGVATLTDSIVIARPWPDSSVWIGGIDVDDRSGTLYAAARETKRCFFIDLKTKQVRTAVPLPAKPYTCLLSRSREELFVSSWGSAQVIALDARSGAVRRTFTVGDHPTAMVESPDGGRLFVANANLNTVSVVDLRSGGISETINSSVLPGQMEGSTPNALALTPDGGRLFIANADNNCLAVIDVRQPGNSRPLGFIPTGWYPTAVRWNSSSSELVVVNGKGSSSKANPRGPMPYHRRADEQYIGSLLMGTLSVIRDPSPSDLAAYTGMVYSNTPHAGPGAMPPALPAVFSGSDHRSPIKHIFYVIRENRTYDQVFGDMPEGNGDSSLVLFGETVTPNAHALARQFVLLDNFFCDAEVSGDGHNWSMGAYATDYVEKSWPTMYSGRGGEYEFEGGYPMVYPSAGYLWDNCARHGVSYRSYGEFIDNGKTIHDSGRALIGGLEGHFAPFFTSWDLDVSDVVRYRQWEEEFDRYDSLGGLPQFQIIKLPNDHTAGTHSGALSPKAFVAQNDYALGLIVQRISRSRYWGESAIFVVEDDAQNGADHVDAHRTVALAISPYTRHHATDHTLYSTSSMVGTMEAILGLPPLSEYDAVATLMGNAFQGNPDMSPYSAREPLMNLEEKNVAGAYGQKESDAMDFSAEDRVPDRLMNDIVWRAVRGAAADCPTPVRSAFVLLRQEPKDDD